MEGARVLFALDNVFLAKLAGVVAWLTTSAMVLMPASISFCDFSLLHLLLK